MNNLDRFFEEADNFAEYADHYRDYLASILLKLDRNELSAIVEQILAARERGSVIYLIGNGGSASAASHWACDLTKNTFVEGQEPLRAISLTDNVAIMTALANDDGYDMVFVDQIKHFLKEKDVVIGISASGNSPNVVKTLELANDRGAITIALVGFDGGTMKRIAKYVVYIQSEIGEYGPVEDVHMVIDHIIASYLQRYLTKLQKSADVPPAQ